MDLAWTLLKIQLREGFVVGNWLVAGDKAKQLLGWRKPTPPNLSLAL